MECFYGVPIAYSDCVGGDRRNFSVHSYEIETSYRLKQSVILTPYEDLHSGAGIQEARKSQTADLSKYYKKSRAVPVEDHHKKYGDRLLNVEPDWEFAPPPPVAGYWEGNRQKQGDKRIAVIKVKISGEQGGRTISALVPNIDWNCTISIEANPGGDNKAQVAGEHDSYPSYEVIVQKSNGRDYQLIYHKHPNLGTLPGPWSLNWPIDIKPEWRLVP